MSLRYSRFWQGRRGLILAVLLLSTFTSVMSLAGEVANQRYTAPDNTFSIVPPDGWEPRDMPGMKYKVFITQPAEKFAPNITFVDEASNLSLKDYVAENQKVLARLTTNYKELSLAPFATDGNLQGYRLSFKNRHADKDLIQTQYYFSTPEKKFVVTCSMAESDKRPISSQCDSSLKTFQVGAK